MDKVLMATSVTNPSATDNQQDQTQQKQSDKELNFARLRNERDRIAQEREAERVRAERAEAELASYRQKDASRGQEEDEDDDVTDENYIDRKTFNKKLSKLDKQIESKIEKRVEEGVQKRIETENQKNFLHRLRSEYRDFDDVMTEEATNRFVEENPVYAKKLLDNKDDFIRREMAYHAIKSMGLHRKPEPKGSEIQGKVDENRKNPYFYAGSVGSPAQAPYQGDFSPQGQKSAYDKMQQLIANRKVT